LAARGARAAVGDTNNRVLHVARADRYSHVSAGLRQGLKAGSAFQEIDTGMIYRLLIDDYDPDLRLMLSLTAGDPRLTLGLYELQGRWRREAVRRLQGVSSFGVEMNRHGLRSPRISNPRVRFYFTERGWVKVGRHVAAEARRAGHIVKVIRRKQPERSQVVYRDLLQLAVLPRRQRAGAERTQ
jgi:hypothetical protein